MTKRYLGDAVYVEPDSRWAAAVKLTTSDGLRNTNTIVLEPEVLAAFLEWIERRKAGAEG